MTKKYHVINRGKVCNEKKNGGLGIKDLMLLNISLLCKWWWKLENEEGIWQKLIRKKYMYNKNVHKVSHSVHGSPV